MIIINGLPGTGKTTLSKLLANEYGYKYVNDWEIFKESKVAINELEDKNLVSEKHSKLIADYVIKNQGTKIVFDFEYSISPNDLIKYELNNLTECFYLGFASLPNKTIFNLFRKSSSNDNVSDDELINRINFFKTSSLDFKKQCEKHNIPFIDVCEDRQIIFNKIIQQIKNI